MSPFTYLKETETNRDLPSGDLFLKWPATTRSRAGTQTQPAFHRSVLITVPDAYP